MRSPQAPQDFAAACGTLDERLQAAFAKVSLAARHDYRRQAADAGLSAIQAQILHLLSREGALEMGEIAARLAFTPATLSDSVAALERRGLVRRDPDVHDRRRVRAAPTRRGKLLGQRLAAWPDLFQQGISNLSDQEKETLWRVMIRIILSLLAQGVIQQARMCVTCTHFRRHVHKNHRQPHHCALVDVPLDTVALRIDCPDHHVGPSPLEALAHLDRLWEQHS